MSSSSPVRIQLWSWQTARQLGVVLLCAGVTLFVLEGLARQFLAASPPLLSHHYAMDVKIHLAKNIQKKDNKPLIVVLGDSKAFHAVYPELIEHHLAQLGMPATVVNLAMDGSTLRMSQQLLYQLYKRQVFPDLIIQNFSPRMVNQAYWGNETVNPEGEFYQTYAGRCILNKINLSPIGKLGCVVEKNSALIRHRAELNKRLKALVNGLIGTSSPLWPSPSPVSSKHETSPKGWSPVHLFFNSANDLLIHGLRKDVFKGIDKGSQFLQFQLDLTPLDSLAKEVNTRLILLWLPEYFPVSNQIYAHYPKVPTPLMLNVKLNEWAAHYPNTGWYNWRENNLSFMHFYNGNHMNSLGGVALSPRLAKLIHQELNSPEEESR